MAHVVGQFFKRGEQMSGYPETGNIQLTIQTITPPDHGTVIQVEEVILDYPDVWAVADYLRQEERASAASITIYVSRNQLQTSGSLEATLKCPCASVAWPSGDVSPIASDLMVAFRSHIARSAEHAFAPLMEVDILGLTQGELAQAKTISQSSPPNDAADGDAIIATPRGRVSVHQRGGYLRIQLLPS